MVFKEITEQDLPRLNELYTQLCGYPSDFQAMCTVWEKEKDNDNYKIFGVYENDNLIGSATVSKCMDLTGDCRYYYSMENFIIEENSRGKGLGTFLLSKVEDYVKERGAAYICFLSAAHRTNAHAFYEKNHYSKDSVKGFKKRFN